MGIIGGNAKYSLSTGKHLIPERLIVKAAAKLYYSIIYFHMVQWL